MELRHAFNNPSLEKKIQQLASNATVSNRFLIKMEIMKLSQEVHRVVDLRTFFKDSCETFSYQGISHFLDDRSKNEFLNEINKYGGNYTLGVYQHIMQKAKTRYKANPHALLKELPTTEEIYLTKIFQRKDERLYFIKKVSVFYNCPEKMTNNAFESFAIEALTTDISSTGLSLKIPKANVRRTDGLIHVWMHGIESEFQFSERVIITYQIRKTVEKNEHIYFSLDYHSKQFSKAKNEFIAFSKSYLEAEKKRNNIPVENTVHAIKAKVSEQFIIARLTSLPVFLIQQDDIWLPRAQFKTKNNSKIGLVSDTKDNKKFLRALCRLPLIQAKLSLGERFSDYFLIMPITDKHNNTHYYALPYQAIAANPLVKKVAKLAHQKKQLMLYRIDGNTVIPEQQCHVPSSLPSSAGEVFENLNQQPIKRAKALAHQLKRMMVLSDVTDSIDYLNLLVDDKNPANKRIHLPDYILKNSAQPVEIFDAEAETHDVRTEDRFICNMNLYVQKKANKSSEFIHCTSINISTRGLKIKLATALDLKVGDQLLIHFPELPGNGKNGVRYQPYHVAGKDSELEYRLFIDGKATDHEGRKMMRSYINKNINTIKPLGYQNEIYGLSRVLRNLFASNIHLPHGITVKEGTSRYIKNIAISENSDIPTFNENNSNDTLNLMATDAFRSAITNKIELINKQKPYEFLYLIVMSRTRANGDDYFFIKPLSESNNDAELMTLMESLRCIGNPRLLRINATKKSRVFNKYFRDEMSYLENFAVTKAKELESDLRDTMGIFEMSDVTHLII